MAAICGVVELAADPLLLIQRALDRMTCRGGELRQHSQMQTAVFGSTRRMTFPLDGLLISDDNNFIVALDGFIFNLPDLAVEHSIPQNVRGVLLALYKKFGVAFVSKLDGSFSLAIWDNSERRLILATDHIASKPLFYTVRCGMAFASEITGLIELTGTTPSLRYSSVDEYLTHMYVPPPHTFFDGINQLEPGHFYVFNGNGIGSKHSYLDSVFSEPTLPTTKESAIPLRELLMHAIRKRTSGWNSLGFCLSGGVDTAALTALSSQMMSPVKTFTLGFPDNRLTDERLFARRTSAYFSTIHTEYEASSACIMSLPALTRHVTAPVGNPAALIADVLFREMSQSVAAAVCGDGGNEVFDGCLHQYQALNFLTSPQHRATHTIKLGRLAWQYIRGTVFEQWFQRTSLHYLSHHLHSTEPIPQHVSPDRLEGALGLMMALETVWTRPAKTKLYTTAFGTQFKSHDELFFLRAMLQGTSITSLMQDYWFARLYSFIPFNVMPYVERTAAANGVFALFPMIDRDVMRYAFRLPAELVYRDGFRSLMRAVFADSMPAEIFNRPMKGFNAPMEWLRTPQWRELVCDCLSEQTVKNRGFFSPNFVQKLVRQFYRGARDIDMQDGRPRNLALALWLLVALEIFCQELSM
jgi:asparagine synthase (glutamine-hydrolysing)